MLPMTGTCSNPCPLPLEYGQYGVVRDINTCNYPNTFDGTFSAAFAGSDYAFIIPGSATERTITVTTLPRTYDQFE